MIRISRRTLDRILPFVGLLLFIGALYLIYRELHGFRYRDVLRYLRTLPGGRILLAVLLTALNYVLLTSYDVLAMAYVGRRLPYRNVALASFLGYSFSIALGHSYLTGGAVRYRLYTSWGVSASDVARIVVFCSMAFWIGYALLGGLTFILAPFSVPARFHLPVPLPIIGVALLLLVAIYFLASLKPDRRVRIFRWTIEAPSLNLAVAQAIVASLDLVVAAGVLLLLLPAGEVSLPNVLCVYLLAVVAGGISQVPGGLGVFDGVLLVLLAPPLNSAGVLGALLAYRGIYYLLPLLLASTTLAGMEAARHRRHVERVAQRAAQWLPRLVPQALAVLTFLAGVVLVLSGSLPAEGARMRWLADLVPLLAVEVSHFLGSLIGAGLLFLAWGIRRRIDAAYMFTLAALGLGILASLFKGGDFEEALFLFVLVLLFIPCREFFYRKSSAFRRSLSPPFLAAVLAVLVSAVWIGLFVYKHVDYSTDLWWRFAFQADAPRFMRGMVGAFALSLGVTAYWLLRPAAPEGSVPDENEMPIVASIVATSPVSEANLALLGDKRILFNEDQSAFVMYAVQGRSWIAMGDPVGSEEEQEDLAWAFRTLSDRHGGRTVFYEVNADSLPLYLDLGLQLFKLGEEARVNLSHFSLGGKDMKSFRNGLRKVESEGGSFEMLPPEEVTAVLPRLREISDRWLADKKAREKGFSLGYFDPAYLCRFPIAIVRQGDTIVAFANVWPTGPKTELSVDLMRHTDAAPRSVMDYLFINLMLWGKAQDYQYFNLGMAPFSGMEARALAPLWSRAGALLFRHGEQFYNFRGLRQYKEKFNPEWEPRYLAAPGGLALPGVIRDVTTLIASGITGVLSK